MEDVEIKFNKQEAQVLVEIIDVAVKSKGLEIAEKSVYFFKKLEEAFKKKEESLQQAE